MSDANQATSVMLARWQFPALDPESEPPPSLSAVPSHPVSLPVADAAEPPDQRKSREIEQAQQEARALRAAIEQAIASGRDEGLLRGHAEGKEEGYAAGFATGSQAAHEVQAALLQRLTNLVERLAAPVPALERTIEEALVALALEIARTVIGAEVAQNPEHLLRLIREALAQAPLPMTGVQVILNPADFEFLRASAPEIEGGGAVIVADPAIEAGGAQILIADTEPTRDRRWHPRGGGGQSQIDLSLAGRWRNAMLTLFDGEDK